LAFLKSIALRLLIINFTFIFSIKVISSENIDLLKSNNSYRSFSKSKILVYPKISQKASLEDKIELDDDNEVNEISISKIRIFNIPIYLFAFGIEKKIFKKIYFQFYSIPFYLLYQSWKRCIP
jgi:hypothetical protein